MLHGPSYVMDFRRHPQFRYSQDINRFLSARLAYYLDRQTVSHDDVLTQFRSDALYRLRVGYDLQGQLEKFERFDPDVVIVTTTYDRATSLVRLYDSIIAQQFSPKIGWVIVENGSSDTTLAQIAAWARWHAGVVFLTYQKSFGYAAPVRNRGLAFVQWASRFRTQDRYIWVIDSDDAIHNEFAVAELYSAAKRISAALTHGFAVCRYEDRYGALIALNTIPREIDRAFPGVLTLKDELDAGPPLLAGMICHHYLDHFYYPDEFTMEDDALARRIMAWSINNRLPVTSIYYPTLLKTFHEQSMSGANARVGNRDIIMRLGPIVVGGIRAQIVQGLIHARDFFTREGV